MEATQILLLALLPVLIAVVSMCSASETSLFSLSRTDRLRLRRLSPVAGAATHRLLSEPRSLILAILLVTNAANITFFVIVSVLQRHMGSGLLAIAFNIALVLTLIVAGDLLPKLLAAPYRVSFARVLAPPLVGVLRVVGPITRFIEAWFVEPFIRLVRPVRHEESRLVSVDELGTLLDLSARSGVIQEDEQRLLADVIRLGSTRIRDVMIPRVAMPWLTDRFTTADVIRTLKRFPALVIPVFRGSLDGRPLGLLDTRPFLPAADGVTDPVRAAAIRDGFMSQLQQIVFIPERARLDQLLDLLRSRHAEQALCVDEYGAVVGMITINEVLREMVAGAPGGEAASVGAIERRSEMCWIVPGRLPARQLALQLGADEAAHAGVSTVAGFFYQILGRVPVEGDTLRLKNIELRVEAMSGRTIDRIAVSIRPSTGSAVPDGRAA